MFTKCLAVLAGLVALRGVTARHDVTLDDTASNIVYTGTWEASSSHPNSLDYGGSHTVSGDKTATATLTFTGVGVQFMSPLWPYSVNSLLTLDNQAGVVVDLQDHSRSSANGGPETVQSASVWQANNLTNGTHTLKVSLAPGGDFVIVDGFVYTVLDSTDASSSSQSSSQSATSVSASVPTSSSASSNSGTIKKTTNVTAIAAGSAAGAVALLAAMLLGMFLCRRRNRMDANRPSDVDLWTSKMHNEGSHGQSASQAPYGAPAPVNFHPAPSAVSSSSLVTARNSGYGGSHNMHDAWGGPSPNAHYDVNRPPSGMYGSPVPSSAPLPSPYDQQQHLLAQQQSQYSGSASTNSPYPEQAAPYGQTGSAYNPYANDQAAYAVAAVPRQIPQQQQQYPASAIEKQRLEMDNYVRSSTAGSNSAGGSSSGPSSWPQPAGNSLAPVAEGGGGHSVPSATDEKRALELRYQAEDAEMSPGAGPSGPSPPAYSG